MLLPAIQYGDWPTVKRRMSKVVTQLKRGAGLIELMTAEGMLDTDDCAGWMIMKQSARGSEFHFQCFVPWRLADEPLRDLRTEATVPSAVEDAVFAASLRTSWGVLGLMSSDNAPWIWLKERHQPFLRAALDAWDELDAVGARYYSSLQGRPLWSVPNNLHFVLAQFGVPAERIRSALPAGGPRALLQYARPAVQA